MSRNISASMKTASVWVQVLIKKKELMEVFLQAGKFKKRTADKSAIRFFCEILPKAGEKARACYGHVPATQMERELMAPSTGPISIARAVPMPWAAVPMASQRISFIFGIKPYISKQIDRKNYNKM